MNRLFCTFVLKEDLENLVIDINRQHSILYNKIFILEFENEKEYIITYNTEQGTLGEIPKNTILVHRKKEFRVLYSINGLNNLIKSLNNGLLDKNYKVNWSDYRNSLILSHNNNLSIIKTSLKKIINL